MKNAEIINFIKGTTTLNTYKSNIVEQNGIVASFIKKTEFTINEIGVYINSEKSYKQFSVFLTILEIETIIQPLLAKHQLFSTGTGDLTYTLNFSTIEPELFKQTLNPSYPKTIKTEQDVLDLLNDLNQYTQNVAEPFFEKWSDLRVLDRFLDTVPQMEVQNYIHEGVLSKALVYKLCNNPKFEEYFNLLYNYYTKRYIDNPTGDMAYKQMHDFIMDFKEVLDKIEPRYNV